MQIQITRSEINTAIWNAIIVLSAGIISCSGSMDGDPMQIANDTMLAIKLALEGQQGVNLGLSAFPARRGGFVPLLKHNTKAFRDTRIGLSAYGGTPLSEALWAVAGQMICLEEDRKVILVVTDGSPNDTFQAKETVQRLSRSGFEVVGIGIKFPAVQSFIKDSIVIEDVNELPTKLFSQLQRLLVA